LKRLSGAELPAKTGIARADAPNDLIRRIPRGRVVYASRLKNSEILQIVGPWRNAGRAVSTACGEIPYAAEQGI
jgi:hypothetical protein